MYCHMKNEYKNCLIYGTGLAPKDGKESGGFWMNLITVLTVKDITRDVWVEPK